ncbi:MAG: hypothetical protein WA082_00390 [Candidatus Moraniibacteriota bacterium]
MKIFKIILIIVCVVVAVVLSLVLYVQYAVRDIDENNLPKIIQADWIDLDGIGRISKFRSGSGHDFSGNGESCRSMKHYFNAKRTNEEEMLISENNGFPAAFSLEGAIPIYSPVDGEIIAVKGEESDLGKQVYIRPEKYQDFTIRLFHVFPIEGYTEGRKVAAGEQIAHIGRLQNTDIAVSLGGSGSRAYVSYFDVMPDEIFAKYQAVGVENRDQLIITQEYRDTRPFKCKGEQFAENHDASGDEFVFINGYRR